MRTGDEGIEKHATGMAVAFQFPILEVERLVAVSGRLPGHRRGGEAAWLERLPLEPALAGIIVPRRATDTDVEVDRGDVVIAEELEGILARLQRLTAGIPPGGVTTLDPGVAGAEATAGRRPIAGRSGGCRFVGQSDHRHVGQADRRLDHRVGLHGACRHEDDSPIRIGVDLSRHSEGEDNLGFRSVVVAAGSTGNEEDPIGLEV